MDNMEYSINEFPASFFPVPRETQAGLRGTTGEEISSPASPHILQPMRGRPQLDEAALYGLAGEIVRAIEPHSEADPAALLIQLLVTFGNFIGRTAHFVAEADRHYTNLFAVIIGASSRARKGTSWSHVRRLFAAVDAAWISCIISGLTSGEGLIHHVRGDDDSTRNDKRVLAVETEFASVLRAQGRQGSWLSTTLRQAWDTDELNVMRRNNPQKVRGAHVSIVGHITADELRSCLQKQDARNGYANRFLWIFAQRSKLLPEGGRFHETDAAPFVARLRAAAEFARGVGEMQRDEGARELWIEIYNGLDEGESDVRIAPYLSRAEAQIMRLACVYALLDCSADVKRVHLEAARGLWLYCEASVRHIFGGKEPFSLLAPSSDRFDNTAQRIRGALIKSGSGGLTRTEISGLFKGRVKADELNRALSELQGQGLVSSAAERTAGRSVTRWYVNKGEGGEEARAA